MARKLKTYVTASGFFEEAIAAPSMKAAIEAWGANPNLFQRGWAKETDDPAIIAAAMAKPGVTVRRPVGSKGAFAQNAALPKSLPATRPQAQAKPHAQKKKEKPHAAKPGKASAKIVNLADARAAKQAATAFEKERHRREKEQAEEDAAEERDRARRADAVRKIETLRGKAEKRHTKAMAAIEKTQQEIDRRRSVEVARWSKEKAKLDAKLDEAR